jgi:hypothetical protein
MAIPFRAFGRASGFGRPHARTVVVEIIDCLVKFEVGA